MIARVKFLSIKKYVYDFDDDTIKPLDFVKVPVTDRDTGEISMVTAVVQSVCTPAEEEIELAQASASNYKINKGRRFRK